MSTKRHYAATVAEFAAALGVSRWTVQRMIAADTIRSTKIGRSRRIPWSEVDRILAEREVPIPAAMKRVAA